MRRFIKSHDFGRLGKMTILIIIVVRHMQRMATLGGYRRYFENFS